MDKLSTTPSAHSSETAIVRAKENAELDRLPSLNEDEFLPPVSPWMVLGGVGMLCGIVISLVLSSILVYKVTIKAAGSIRPVGELRLVEAGLDGTVVRIEAEEHQEVRVGDVIARLDSSQLETSRRQIEEDIRQREFQLDQIEAELATISSRLVAETNLMERSIDAARASLSLEHRRHTDRTAIAEANLAEASSQLRLAEVELARFVALEGTGIVSQHQIDEKVASVRLAEANLRRAQAEVSPTNAEIAIAEQEIAQQRASGTATLAALQQQREQVLLRRIELENKLQTAQKDLDRIELDLERTIMRSPVNGTLLQLSLRNPGQVLHSGEGIAYVAPAEMPLEFKAQVASQDIGNVELGQPVTVRVAACPYTDFGVMFGEVSAIAPDATPQQSPTTSGASAPGGFFNVTIAPDDDRVGSGDRVCLLQPGMQGKADIITSEETILTFLLRKARLLSNL